MRLSIFLIGFYSLGLFFSSCKKEEPTGQGQLEIHAYNPYVSHKKQGSGWRADTFQNPPLTGDTTATITTSFKVIIGDVWVSQEEVVAGESDDLEWHRLTAETNYEHKYFEDYTMPPVTLPVGLYKSVKMTFRNVFYRQVVLAADSTVTYELLETMGSTFDPCDENDTSWAKTNYITATGNYITNASDEFEMVAPGERVGNFEIKEASTTVLTWRLGAGVETPCTTLLVDLNSNLSWDCGTDDMIHICPPEAIYMWDFLVSYP